MASRKSRADDEGPAHYEPRRAFRKAANVRDDAIYEEGEDLEAFWAKRAEDFVFFSPWERVLDWEPPDARWFVGATTNLTVNCLDRHVEAGRGDKVAFHWEGEPGDERTLTYAELLAEVCRFANGLQALGVGRGDRVTLYMGMVPELAIAVLACARIGAPHSVVFGGFSADALRERIHDSGSRVLVCADGAWRRAAALGLKAAADEAMAGADSPIEHCVVVRRVGDALDTPMQEGRDVWWHDLVDGQETTREPEAMDAEDPLFLLYTSGTTGKPKGIVHTTAGYMVGTAVTARWVFDLKEDDVYWCTADIGWITGHSYVIYGPLANGVTSVMYEGAPDHPDWSRFWSIVERRGVTIFYTAPTAIRAFMRHGDEPVEKHDLSSLRLLGTVGEPINPSAWRWYHEVVGGGRCPIVDTWWQTETGAIMISPLPGITATKPGSACHPLPGVVAEVVDEKGKALPPGKDGLLVLDRPWPSMLRGIHGDEARYRETYWSRFPGRYLTGDGARRDEDGYLWITGRVDDVMIVSGHNVSSAEVESALVGHEAVTEAAVVGRTHEVKGQAISAFVTLRDGVEPSEGLAIELRAHVARRIGAICRPAEVHFAPELPKTRSGKIMRRLLRDIAEGRALGDTTTLADPGVVGDLREELEHEER